MKKMEYLKAFITGGAICFIAQILIDKTKLTSARILVFYVVLGCILGGLGIYEYIENFGGAGATAYRLWLYPCKRSYGRD